MKIAFKNACRSNSQGLLHYMGLISPQLRSFSSVAVTMGDLQSKMVADQVKVEYAFETARLRLYLPQQGDTWFFTDRATTLGDLKAQCKTEDTLVQEVKFLEEQNGMVKEISDEENLYTRLTAHNHQKGSFLI